MERDLVFDIGVNNRDDTAHCLRRGSRVVGFDADYLIELAGLRVCEKHSVGSLTTSRSRPATLRRVVYKGMCHLLPGEPRGTTRLYVLARSAAGPRPHGADQAW